MKLTITFLVLFLSNSLYANEVKRNSSAKPTLGPACTHALTYKLESWRRLGDNIITLCKAEYFAEIYNLTLLYKPFPYSDQFALDQSLKPLNRDHNLCFKKMVVVNSCKDIEEHLPSDQPILFESHFLSETPWLYCYSRQTPLFEKKLKELFTPVIKIEDLAKPPAVVTVALHVRKGGGFDHPLASKQQYSSESKIEGLYLKKSVPGNSCADIWPLKWYPGIKYIEAVQQFIEKKSRFSDYIWPIKFPPDQYYIDHLMYLSNFLEDRQLLVYLFTDDPNPLDIVKRYSDALRDYPRIIFSCRPYGNHHTKNVIQDLFAIIQCDCLISASSSFAHAAQLLGNHSICIMPTHAITLPEKVIMNKVAVFGMNNALDMRTRSLFLNELSCRLK